MTSLMPKDPLSVCVTVDTDAPSIESLPMRRLWCAVLLNALKDMQSKESCGEAERGRRTALLWLGTPDFREVCELIGLDPRSVEKSVRAKLARGERIVHPPQYTRSKPDREIAV